MIKQLTFSHLGPIYLFIFRRWSYLVVGWNFPTIGLALIILWIDMKNISAVYHNQGEQKSITVFYFNEK